jgi:hypothetical protein
MTRRPRLEHHRGTCSFSGVVTTNAGAEALIACQGIEALLVPSDGRLDFNGDDINVG